MIPPWLGVLAGFVASIISTLCVLNILGFFDEKERE